MAVYKELECEKCNEVIAKKYYSYPMQRLSEGMKRVGFIFEKIEIWLELTEAQQPNSSK
jgi:hypothetical protein